MNLYQIPFSEAPEAQPETEAQYYQTGLMIEASKVPYIGCHRAPDTRVARVWRALTGR